MEIARAMRQRNVLTLQEDLLEVSLADLHSCQS